MRVKTLRPVILESPYAGDVERNVKFARLCLKDSILRGESPLASHLLYTQEGILDDNDLRQRELGIEAGFSWYSFADAIVVYTNYGISSGMKRGIDYAQLLGIAIEYRTLEEESLEA